MKGVVIAAVLALLGTSLRAENFNLSLAREMCDAAMARHDYPAAARLAEEILQQLAADKPAEKRTPDDWLGFSLTRQTLGIALEETGQQKAALVAYEASLADLEKSGAGPAEIAGMVHSLGLSQQANGQMEAAEQSLRRAVDGRQGTPHAVESLLALADLLLKRGRASETQKLLATAGKLEREPSIAFLQVSQRCERCLGDFASALPLTEKLVSRLASEVPGSHAHAVACTELAGTLVRLGKRAEAEKQFMTSARILSLLPREPAVESAEEACLSSLSVLQLDMGRAGDALETLRQALALPDHSTDPTNRLTLWNSLVNAALATQEMDTAENASAAAALAASKLPAVHALHASVTLGQAQLAFAQKKVAKAQELGLLASTQAMAWLETTLAEGTDTQLLTLRRTIDPVSPLLAFGSPAMDKLEDILDRTQGRLLQALLARQQSFQNLPTKERAAVEDAQKYLDATEAASGSTSAAAVAARRELAGLLSQHLPKMEVPKRAAVPPDSLLVTYVLFRKPQPSGTWQLHYGALLRQAAQPSQWLEIGPVERINGLTLRLHDLMETAISHAQTNVRLDTPLADLGQLLWPPPLLAAAKGKQRILVQPDGLLHFVPWAILAATKGGPALVDQFPCLEIIAQPKSAKPWPKVAELALSLMPVADAPGANLPPEPTELVEPFTSVLWQTLAGAEALDGVKLETSQVGRIFGEKRLPVAAISGEQSLRAAPLQGVLHFACHGFAFAQESDLDVDPWLLYRAGLVLGKMAPNFCKANTLAADNLLFAAEIPRLSLQNCPLVVLSACQSGVGKPELGETFQGLIRAFLSAGTPRVLASVQVLDDATAPAFLADFYRQLINEAHSPAQALWETQRAWLKKENLTPSQRLATVGAWLLVNQGWD